MKLLTLALIIINFVVALSFAIGFIMNFKSGVNPKHKALVGLIIGISTTVYLAGLIALSIIYICLNKLLLSGVFLFFAMIPFIIGYLVKYDTLKKYSYWQLVFFIGSLLILIRLF